MRYFSGHCTRPVFKDCWFVFGFVFFSSLFSMVPLFLQHVYPASSTCDVMGDTSLCSVPFCFIHKYKSKLLTSLERCKLLPASAWHIIKYFGEWKYYLFLVLLICSCSDILCICVVFLSVLQACFPGYFLALGMFLSAFSGSYMFSSVVYAGRYVQNAASVSFTFVFTMISVLQSS